MKTIIYFLASALVAFLLHLAPAVALALLWMNAHALHVQGLILLCNLLYYLVRLLVLLRTKFFRRPAARD